LALQLGMSVKRAQAEISAAEFAEWIAFFNLEPMPNPWLQHGILCQLIAGALGNKSAKPEHFMPKRKKVQPISEMQAMAKAWAANTGKKQ